MRKTYQIDLRHQLRSCRRLMFYVYMTLIPLAVIFFLMQGRMDGPSILIGTGIFWFMALFALPFHIQYLAHNWNTKLHVDRGSETITIEDKTGIHTFRIQDVKTERHLPPAHSPGFIKSYRPDPSEYYGYVKLETKEKVFYITSLMTDPFDFPLPINSTKYRLPFITNVTDEDIKRAKAQQQEEQIQKFMSAFDNLPDANLIDKVHNRKRFEREAVEAAIRILQKRKQIN